MWKYDKYFSKHFEESLERFKNTEKDNFKKCSSKNGNKK
jgi:hypothetical protein